MFDNILERKKAFLDSKITKLKKLKIWYFSKGLVHGFGQKFELYPSSLFKEKKGQENVFDDILERKKRC